MKAGGGGQNARQRYLETKEQHLWGGVDVHLGFNMLMDPACKGEREIGLVCVFVCAHADEYI